MQIDLKGVQGTRVRLHVPHVDQVKHTSPAIVAQLYVVMHPCSPGVVASGHAIPSLILLRAASRHLASTPSCLLGLEGVAYNDQGNIRSKHAIPIDPEEGAPKSMACGKGAAGCGMAGFKPGGAQCEA